MQAVVLAGGLGTRLSEVLPDTPKALAPIGEKTFLHFVLTLLKSGGVEKVLLLTGYLGEKIRETFPDGSDYGLQINFIKENSPLGTGGALVNAIPFLEDEFLVLNGDTFFDIDLKIFEDFYRKRHLEALVALRFTENTERYGLVSIDDDFRVSHFIEKESLPEDQADGFINGGIYFLKKNLLLKYRGKGIRPLSFEKYILPNLVGDKKLYGLPIGGKFIDIGIPSDYRLAQKELPDWINKEKRPCLFLDRDGVLVEDTGYVHGFDLKFIPETMEIVREANQKRHWVIVATNQAGVAKGFFDETQVQATNRFIKDKYNEKGLKVNAFFYCPFHPEGLLKPYRKYSLARKPGPGMLLMACENFPVDMKNSIMVGDKASDQIKLPYLDFQNFSLCRQAKYNNWRIPLHPETGASS